jgi:hypothetical protein
VEPMRETGRVPEWIVRFPTDGSTFEPSLGDHLLYVKLRDVNMTETRCLFRVKVLPGPGILVDRKILYVDDNEANWLENPYRDFEEKDDELWEDILETFPYEVIDTGRQHEEREVDINFVNTATTVVWNVDQVLDAPDTELYKLTTERGNYLYSYVNVGGNLIIIGKDAVYNTMYWPDGTIWKGTNSGGGSDLRNQLDATFKNQMTSWDFTPLGPEMTESGDSVFNWMWEIFGVERMEYPSNPSRPLSALISCDACDPAFRDTITTIESPVPRDFTGTFSSMVYITELRDDMEIRKLYSAGLYDSTAGAYDDYGESFLIAIYVPATGNRGHVAYIGAPLFWFDHDKVASLIRQLLLEFGEQPIGF